jgi:Zn-dependent M28 family amino/carboxypeptidase
MSRTPLRIGAVVVAAAATALSFTPLVQAAPAVSQPCDTRVNNTHAKLMECITLEGVRAHQAAFQAIADANGGTRAAGTPGYDASVDYVVEKMEATGPFTGTGYGSVTAAVAPVDLALAPPQASTSGCEAADFAGFPAGNIALIQRGTCSFGIKAANAQAAGAAGVIIFNQGNTPLREGLIVGTLLPDGAAVTIPVVGGSFADGVALSQPGSTAYINVPAPQEITQVNVIAQSKWGNPSNVVMAGAHLDSVQAGPGINDNGSGSAAILETAIQMSKVRPTNAVRFAWWGAEESGLIGSEEYVAGLSQEEQDKIALYLNFDMVGSPNHVFFVYDGDDSDFAGAGPGPEGSAQIEKTFEAFYTQVGEPFKGTDFSGRSDYGPFIAEGIPSGGLFTGAEGVKTAAEVELWGGTAGQQYDPCYHLACDTYANNNDHALEVNSDAIGFSVLQYAMNTFDVNGLPGKDNFPPVSGSATDAPVASTDLTGGGLHDHDHDHGPTETE